MFDSSKIESLAQEFISAYRSILPENVLQLIRASFISGYMSGRSGRDEELYEVLIKPPKQENFCGE